MTNAQRQVVKRHLNLEAEELGRLRENYARALTRTRQRLRQQMERIPTDATAQTIAHRIGYARAEERELLAALRTLGDTTTVGIDEYLRDVYTNGYWGTNYSLNQDGIPVSLGVDHQRVLSAIQQPVDGYTFSQRIHGDVVRLAQRVRADIALGYSTGLTFQQIAEQIALEMDMSLKRAYTIARTEGARVQSVARNHAMVDAKLLGADIIKVWDATLDTKTRPEHGKLDGQVAEVGSDFVIDGMRAQYPTGFGDPGMDINCRCIVLERSRHAVNYEKEHGRLGTRFDGVKGIRIPNVTYTEWLDRKTGST